MKKSTLLCLALLLLLLAAASPLAGAWSSHISCGIDGRSYAANSTYEANFHRLAAVLVKEASASPSGDVDLDRVVGYWPNRPRAVTTCRGGGHGDDCAACIADAFKRVEARCPFSKEATFFSWNCSLSLSEVRISGVIPGNYLFGRDSVTQILVTGMAFQAFGLACLFLKFLQTWRHDTKNGTILYGNTGSRDSNVVQRLLSALPPRGTSGPKEKDACHGPGRSTAQEASQSRI